ncbi:blue copper protein-like protein [Carex littledalei]|uniref:Blue copper protein-like protein n=1 Tax=Carex littledalei TaxID=544730 RepID=A0A833R9W5_9POAL|nr:blue copper protein-like protein [Carex littledalei]
MSNCSIWSILSCFLILFLCSQCTQAYKNYTVGDELGWYDKLEVSSVDYQKWADGKNFSLGDFLIFHTDKNHSVVQTYNATTFKICDADQDMNTTEWSVSNPEYSKDAVTVHVPLLKEGPTYFFSDFYDGEQCLNGQKFTINVTHGEGLPDSLKDPAPGPASADDVPPNDVPANFDHPIDDNSTSSDPLKPVAGLGNRNWAGFGFSLSAVVFGSLGLFG